jgi:pyruvate formate lyase activating enzyme
LINGINKASYNDYPGEVSYVIFLGGCNFKCPYCHNSSIVNRTTQLIDEQQVFKDLLERKKMIKAVVITGGEPTIYGDELIRLILKIKEHGFKIKLDTNGTNPILLKKIINEKMIDYIAMDIKNTFAKYEETSGCKVNLDKIKESIKIIENGNINYEFRTTINRTNHTMEDIDEIKSYLINSTKLIFQNYQYTSEQINDYDYGSFSDDELHYFINQINIIVKNI